MSLFGDNKLDAPVTSSEDYFLPSLEWIPFRSVAATILNLGDWEWFRNSQCKYIKVWIDMRDGRCVIFDRDGNRLTLEDLKRQE
jgi:hypothetical protein